MFSKAAVSILALATVSFAAPAFVLPVVGKVPVPVGDVLDALPAGQVTDVTGDPLVAVTDLVEGATSKLNVPSPKKRADPLSSVTGLVGSLTGGGSSGSPVAGLPVAGLGDVSGTVAPVVDTVTSLVGGGAGGLPLPVKKE